MITLTRAQREALWRVFLREHGMTDQAISLYRQFRQLVQPGPDCIMIPFAGMWLGIERDGYTHS